MFERFTERAIKVIMLAQEEARRLGHNFVGSEQIMLGIIGEGGGIGSRALRGAGVTLSEARVEVERIIGRGNGFVAVEIPFTPRAKKALENSWDAARRLKVDYINTEHLLLGILMLDDGIAIRVLDKLNVDRTRLRRAVVAATSGKGVAGSLPEQLEVPENNQVTQRAFGFYDSAAHEVIRKATSVSYTYGTLEVGTRQLALGLLSHADMTAFIQDCYPDLAQTRQKLLSGLATGTVSGEEFRTFDTRAKEALGRAWAIARELKQSYVTPITIYLAMLEVPDDDGASALRESEEQVTRLKSKLHEAAARTAFDDSAPEDGEDLLADPIPSVRWNVLPLVRPLLIAAIVLMLTMILLPLARF